MTRPREATATDDPGPVAALVEDILLAATAALVAWAAVFLVAEALGSRPWRWPGGAVAALAVVGVPALVARRRYDASLPDGWLEAGVAFLAGAVVASVAMLGWVVASLSSDGVPLPRWVLSEPVALVAVAAGGLLGVGFHVARERERRG